MIKRCSALWINRAIKALRRAEKQSGAVWGQAIRLEVVNLERLLLITGHLDLLDSRAVKDLEAAMKEEEARG